LEARSRESGGDWTALDSAGLWTGSGRARAREGLESEPFPFLPLTKNNFGCVIYVTSLLSTLVLAHRQPSVNSLNPSTAVRYSVPNDRHTRPQVFYLPGEVSDEGRTTAAATRGHLAALKAVRPLPFSLRTTSSTSHSPTPFLQASLHAHSRKVTPAVVKTTILVSARKYPLCCGRVAAAPQSQQRPGKKGLLGRRSCDLATVVLFLSLPLATHYTRFSLPAPKHHALSTKQPSRTAAVDTYSFYCPVLSCLPPFPSPSHVHGKPNRFHPPGSLSTALTWLTGALQEFIILPYKERGRSPNVVEGERV